MPNRRNNPILGRPQRTTTLIIRVRQVVRYQCFEGTICNKYVVLMNRHWTVYILWPGQPHPSRCLGGTRSAPLDLKGTCNSSFTRGCNITAVIQLLQNNGDATPTSRCTAQAPPQGHSARLLVPACSPRWHPRHLVSLELRPSETG